MKLRFSISNVLLVIVVCALACLVDIERRRYIVLKAHANSVEEELGYIDVGDPSKIHLRYLRCDAPNTWQYQVYIPEDADYVIEFGHNTGARLHYGNGGTPLAAESGQNPVTLSVGQNILKPNDVSVHTFMANYMDRASGITFQQSSVRFLANDIGNYENEACRLGDFRSHNKRVDTYAQGEVIPLLLIKESSKSPRQIDGKPAEIAIRLAPKRTSLRAIVRSCVLD